MKRSNKTTRLYTILGALLGLGAPLGWLFCRAVFYQDGWLTSEMSRFGGLYLYMTLGTAAAFSFFGFVAGQRGDRLMEGWDKAKEQLDKANEIAFRDALTGIHNSRYLHDHLSLEIEAARRYHNPLACIMLDIDNFKGINDKFGHPVGDAVLSALAEIVSGTVRRIDIVGRLGGEEFLVIMPHTPINSALQIAERIRQAVDREGFVVGDLVVPVTVSLGLASFPGAGVSDKSSLLKAVDDALYEAKRTGKNRTVIAHGSAVAQLSVS